MAGTGPSVVVLAASGMPAESVSQISAPEWDVVSRSGLKRKLHPGMSAQNGMNFPNEVACGSCVPDSDSRVGCRFRLRSLAEAVSRNRASEWECFPVRSSSGNCVPDSSLGMGRAFRMGFKRKLCPRIDMASSGKRVLEYRAGVFGGRGWKGEHCLHARRRRGGDPHGGTWGVVILRFAVCGVLGLHYRKSIW